jgi:hypothetical protein
MSTHALGRRARPRVAVRPGVSAHWAWLAGGFLVAFAVPFLFADLLQTHTSSRAGYVAPQIPCTKRAIIGSRSLLVTIRRN